MFCENCGSQIPDGSKFCTECGSPIASAPASVEPPAENVSIPQPSAPGNTPSGAETPFWQQPSAEPEVSTWQQPAAEPAAPTWQQPVAPTWQQPAAEPAAPTWQQPAAEPRSGDNNLGYSTPGSGASPSYAPRPAVSPEIKSSGSRWWLWLIIGLVIVALLVTAAYLLLRARSSDAPLTPPTTAGNIRENASGLADAVHAAEPEPTAVPEAPEIPEAPEVPGVEVPGVEVPEVTVPENPEESAAPEIEVDPDVKALADEVDKHLTEENILHEVITDEDSITVYYWYDGVDELTDKAGLDGDEEALAKWDEDIEYMRQLSEDILADLDSIGKADTIFSIVGIQDDLYPDAVLAYALDGEVVYDWVNNIDLLGIAEG